MTAIAERRSRYLDEVYVIDRLRATRADVIDLSQHEPDRHRPLGKDQSP